MSTCDLGLVLLDGCCQYHVREPSLAREDEGGTKTRPDHPDVPADLPAEDCSMN